MSSTVSMISLTGIPGILSGVELVTVITFSFVRSKNQGQYGKRDKDSVERSSERGLSRKGHRKKRKHEDEHRR